VILTSLLTFSDSNEVQHTPTPKSTLSTPTVLEPPPLPSKPDPKSGVDRIAELQAARGEVNEVTVEPEGEVNDYAAYVDNLLRVCPTRGHPVQCAQLNYDTGRFDVDCNCSL